MGNLSGNLTKREIEILRLVSKGMKNGAIAEKLFISSRTVETHKRHLLIKLHLKSTSQLTCLAAAILTYLHNNYPNFFM